MVSPWIRSIPVAPCEAPPAIKAGTSTSEGAQGPIQNVNRCRIYTLWQNYIHSLTSSFREMTSAFAPTPSARHVHRACTNHTISATALPRVVMEVTWQSGSVDLCGIPIDSQNDLHTRTPAAPLAALGLCTQSCLAPDRPSEVDLMP